MCAKGGGGGYIKTIFHNALNAFFPSAAATETKSSSSGWFFSALVRYVLYFEECNSKAQIIDGH